MCAHVLGRDLMFVQKKYLGVVLDDRLTLSSGWRGTEYDCAIRDHGRQQRQTGNTRRRSPDSETYDLQRSVASDWGQWWER